MQKLKKPKKSKIDLIRKLRSKSADVTREDLEKAVADKESTIFELGAMSSHQFGDLLYNAYTMRSEFLRRGLSDEKRDINKECGYPNEPDIKQYREQYDREIGARVVDIFPDESWKNDPELLEKPDGDYTPWETEIQNLVKKHNIYDFLNRADCVSGIGRFGIIFIGLNDGLSPDKAVAGINLKTGEFDGKTGVKAKREINFLRCFSEGEVKINQWNTDPKSSRYMKPEIYEVNMSSNSLEDAGGQSVGPENTSLRIHWTRVIHLADNMKTSANFGRPRMKPVFNRLCDLRKICGGSGEMYWKGGFPGLVFETQPQSEGVSVTEMTPKDRKRFRAEIESYQSGLQRYMALVGMTAKSLTPQIADPEHTYMVCIKSICATLGIPYRIFMGTEEAQLAGSQDTRRWNDKMKKRAEKYIAPSIILPFFNRLMAMGVISFSANFFVSWDDFNSQTDAEKADVGLKRTQALSQYISAAGNQMVGELEFLTYFLGFSTEIAQGMINNSTGIIVQQDDNPDDSPVVDPAEDEEESESN